MKKFIDWYHRMRVKVFIHFAQELRADLVTLEERFKKEVSDIRADAETTETALRETVTGTQSELRQTLAEHLKYHESAEKQLGVKIETDASACFEAATVRLSTLIQEQAATAEFSRVNADLSKHTEAIRHLAATKRDGAGLRGNKPALLQ